MKHKRYLYNHSSRILGYFAQLWLRTFNKERKAVTHIVSPHVKLNLQKIAYLLYVLIQDFYLQQSVFTVCTASFLKVNIQCQCL